MTNPQESPAAAALIGLTRDDDRITPETGPAVGSSDADADAAASGADIDPEASGAHHDSDGVPVGRADADADRRASGG